MSRGRSPYHAAGEIRRGLENPGGSFGECMNSIDVSYLLSVRALERSEKPATARSVARRRLGSFTVAKKHLDFLVMAGYLDAKPQSKPREYSLTEEGRIAAARWMLGRQ